MATTETVSKIPELISQMTHACTDAAGQLHKTMQTTTLPHHYVIPKMSLKLQLEMSVSEGAVRGFFKKTTANTRAEALSTISFDIVAVPKTDVDAGE